VDRPEPGAARGWLLLKVDNYGKIARQAKYSWIFSDKEVSILTIDFV
jgi:hypothetical protein